MKYQAVRTVIAIVAAGGVVVLGGMGLRAVHRQHLMASGLMGSDGWVCPLEAECDDECRRACVELHEKKMKKAAP